MTKHIRPLAYAHISALAGKGPANDRSAQVARHGISERQVLGDYWSRRSACPWSAIAVGIHFADA